MKKLILTVALLISSTNIAQAVEAKSAVTDKNGDPVRSIVSGECVRHSFNDGTDVCAPPPPPAPEPAPVVVAPQPEPEPVAYLTNEELTVYFDFAKSSINTSEVVKLNNLIKALIASEGVESLSIVGYADRIGNAKANQRLSEKRTAAVQAYLNDKVNIPTEILKSTAKGEENPVTDCKKNQKRKSLISCLAADRRVEIVLNYYTF